MRFDKYTMPSGKTYVRSVDNGSVTEQDFLEYIEKSSTLTKADGVAVLEALKSFLASNLTQAKTITFANIGTFGASFTIKEKEGRQTGRDVELKRVTFKASSKLKQTISEGTVMHQKAKGMRYSEKQILCFDNRREKLREMLQTETQILITDYVNATSVSRGQAGRDLKKFVAEGWLEEKHFGMTKVYSLK